MEARRKGETMFAPLITVLECEICMQYRPLVENGDQRLREEVQHQTSKEE